MKPEMIALIVACVVALLGIAAIFRAASPASCPVPGQPEPVAIHVKRIQIDEVISPDDLREMPEKQLQVHFVRTRVMTGIR